MATTQPVSTDGGPPTGTPRAPRTQRALRRPAVAVVAVLGLLAGAGWWLSPDAFEPWRGGESMSLTAPLTYEDSVLLPLPQVRRPIHVLQAEARVVADGGTRVEVVVCDGGSPFAGVTRTRAGRVVEGCVRARPAAGELVEPPDQLAVLVNHGGADEVRVDGLDVLYRDGVRLGYQHTGDVFRAYWTGTG
ncbi:hypothetical protein [Jannaschia sp. R86511]|uniref:hypothetical protein n=1 Tax=Jannaschia sp. R86511 TaxID=3093853 RepID=UPI0036D24294